MRRRTLAILGILIVVVGIAGILYAKWKGRATHVATGLVGVRYGISPYQDTILPRVAEKLGWDREDGLDIDTKMLEWGDVMPALASGAVDVAIQNFNSFQATYENINTRGGDVIFYYPFYVFKGAAIMVRSDSGLKSLEEMKKSYPDVDKAITETIMQLKGKTIFTTTATEKEQLVLLALEKAGMRPQDVRIVHAQPDESLNAFLHGDADAFTGGVTDQLKARKEGHKQMITAADLGLVVIDGLVTTKRYAEANPEVLGKLIRLWFRTIRYLEEDLDTRAQLVIEDLNREGSFTFDVEDYKYTWFDTEIYPDSPAALADLVMRPDSKYFWKKSWDENNKFLRGEAKITKPVPYEAFWMERVQRSLD